MTVTSATVVLVVMALIMLPDVQGQRRRNNPNSVENDYRDPATLAERRNIGPNFPYKRGDTPIFHFDLGDEPFIDTLKPLIEGVYQMTDQVVGQRQITKGFGEAFAACEDCG